MEVNRVPKITALFEARNQISPELVKVQREVQRSRQAMGGLDNETKKMLQDIGRMGQSMDRTAREFARDASRMQREIHGIRSELNRLGSMREKPRVEIDNQASNEIANIRQQLLSLGGIAAGIAIGSNVGNMMSEAEAAFKERALYAARGKTQQEMQLFDQKAKELITNNPYMNRAEAMATLAASERYNGANAGSYADVATKLGVTTRYSPEEHLKMMAVLRENTGVDDATRLGNAIQYMSNNLKDFKDEFVDSIIEYSVQTSKFLDTPEKMAALVGEIGRMGIWSDDKAFDALKEATLKLTNQGDLTNVLKTGYETQGMDSDKALKLAETEAAEINKLINSENKADNQAAMGRMMLTLATIQDKNVRQQVLNELGAGPGEDLGRYFAPLLEYAGKLSIGQVRPQIGDELNRSYKLATENNPLFEYQKAQNEAKQAVIDFGAKIEQDVTPAMSLLADCTKWLVDKFNAMPDIARYGLELAAAGGAVLFGGVLLIRSATAHLRAARALEAAARSMGGGPGPDLDIGGKGGKKRKWWNSKTWKRDTPEPQARKWLSTEEARKAAFDGPDPAKEATKKGLLGGLKERISSMLPSKEKLKEFGGKAWQGLKNIGGAATETIGKYGGAVLRKLPLIGSLFGAGQILMADNKLETAGKVGAEALGGWGGAAAGAAIGSVIPGIGTAVGGIVGGIAGALGGGALFDKVKAWWSDAPATPPDRSEMKRPTPREELDKLRPAPAVAGPPVPPVSPAGKAAEKPKSVSVSVSSMPITLRAEGVLQDVAGMIRLLRDPAVSNEVKRIIEKALIDALETRGGVAGGGAPA
jgi:hypothetical protein